MEILEIKDENKASRYEELLPQLSSLLKNETDFIAACANFVAALHQTFNWLWVGFYRIDEEQLLLGPFQGSIACARIPFGKGVCGMAWKERRTIIVDDVNQFPGHIACSSSARSEIVLPLYNQTGDIVGVLDIDASTLAAFDETDAAYLAECLTLIQRLC